MTLKAICLPVIFYISWEMTPTSIGGEKQAGISGGSHLPADIASGRIAEVRSRSMSCNCMTRTSQQECRGILEILKKSEKGGAGYGILGKAAKV